MSHTPGEWFLHVNQAHNDFSITNEDDDVVIASTPIRNIDDVYLLAAAPELLEALKGFVEVIKMNCLAQKKNINAADANQINWQSFYEPAIEAIAKAEGK